MYIFDADIILRAQPKWRDCRLRVCMYHMVCVCTMCVCTMTSVYAPWNVCMSVCMHHDKCVCAMKRVYVCVYAP